MGARTITSFVETETGASSFFSGAGCGDAAFVVTGGAGAGVGGCGGAGYPIGAYPKGAIIGGCTITDGMFFRMVTLYPSSSISTSATSLSATIFRSSLICFKSMRGLTENVRERRRQTGAAWKLITAIPA